MLTWFTSLLGSPTPPKFEPTRIDPGRKTNFRSCRLCGAVSIPDGDLCPECLVEHHHVPDPFEDDSTEGS